MLNRWDRRSDRALVIAVVLVGLLLALPGVLLRDNPNSDGLYYEAQVAQLEGLSQQDALHATFTGERARLVADIEDRPRGVVRVLDPAWVKYSAQFFHRRWVVPALALGLHKLTGADIPDALQYVSIAGYALIGVALFGLLRRRFRPSTSMLVALGCMLSPILYRWSFGQSVDSWGVLLESLGMLALVLVADRGLRWLPLWGLTVLALSLTRDTTMVLGVGALGLLVAQRHDRAALRRNAWVVAVGGVAAAPALLLGGAPIRASLAYVCSGYTVPLQDDWGFVAQCYPPKLWGTVSSNVLFPARYGTAGILLYATIIVALVCIAAVAVQRTRDDALIMMARASILGCVLLLLVANSAQGYRLELVFVPVVAVGAAVILTRMLWPSTPAMTNVITNVVNQRGVGQA